MVNNLFDNKYPNIKLAMPDPPMEEPKEDEETTIDPPSSGSSN